MQRELACKPVRDTLNARHRSPRRLWVFVGVVIVLVGSGCGGSSTDGSTDQSEVESTQPISTTALEVSATASTEVSNEPGDGEASGQTSDTGPKSAIDFDDALLEQAISDALATPSEGIATPGRDVVATSLIIEEFTTAGFDLTGLEIVVYPLTTSESVLVLLTDDSTALISVEEGLDLLVTQLMASPSVAQFDIERLVIQHSSADDEGPFVVTFAAALSDLQEALDTGVDIFDRVAVQLERT